MIAKSDWKLLGIKPTADIRQIKRAYAKNLKLHSPEDDPIQFQILREVYENALQYAQYAQYADSSIDTFDSLETDDTEYKDDTFRKAYITEPVITENEYNKTVWVENRWNEVVSEEIEASMPAYEKFTKQVYSLYEDFSNRLDLKKWEDILVDEVLWDVETYRLLKEWFLDFLNDGHFLPSEILKAYNKYFLWELESDEYQYKYGETFLTYIRELLTGIVVPGYEYLTKKYDKDIDDYIRYREYGFAQCLSGDWNNAKQSLSNAIEMIPDDPYLLCIFGAYSDTVSSTNGKEYIELGAELSYDPYRMYLFSGQLLRRIGKYDKAFRYFIRIPKTSYYYIFAQSGAADCLCDMNRYHKCGVFLRSRLKKKGDHSGLNNSLYRYYDSILDLMESNPYHFIFWYEARKTFPYLRGYRSNNPLEFKLKYTFHSLAYVMATIIILWLILATKGVALVLFLIIYKIKNWLKSKQE